MMHSMVRSAATRIEHNLMRDRNQAQQTLFDCYSRVDARTREAVLAVGPNGLLRQVTKTVLESALNAELDEHLGYQKGDVAGKFGTNERNGSSSKTARTDVGEVRINVPRDREGMFTPQIVPKYARRVDGFDETVISLHAKGLTTGEIQAYLEDIYEVRGPRDLISKITDKVIDDLNSWQARPLIACIRSC